MALARQHRRPIILHNLKAAPTLWQSIRKTAFDSGGIVHAFSGSPEEAQTWIRQGFLIGIGSLLLNPNARKVRRAAALDVSNPVSSCYPFKETAVMYLRWEHYISVE